MNVNGLIATCAILFAASAHAAIIANEDFEGGAIGWSNNTTDVEPAPFSRFLGRFDGTQLVSKTYALTGTQTEVSVSYDILEIDSWDNEFFNVFIDDQIVAIYNFTLNSEDSAANGLIAIFPGDDGATNYGFEFFSDQAFRDSMVIATTATSIKLAFGATLNSPITDESWGVDNILIVDNSAVPVPAAVWLFGSGSIGLMGFARRRKA